MRSAGCGGAGARLALAGAHGSSAWTGDDEGSHWAAGGHEAGGWGMGLRRRQMRRKTAQAVWHPQACPTAEPAGTCLSTEAGGQQAGDAAMQALKSMEESTNPPLEHGGD